MSTDTPSTSVQPSTWIDPNKGFLERPPVRRALKVVAVVCTILVGIAFWDTPTVLLNADGLREFASRLQVPLGAFTLTIPFFALVAAAHRSEQTKHQMELTRRQIERTDKQILIASDQNNFSNLYKHIEEFGKYCEAHVAAPLKVSSHRKMHGMLYPRARHGELVVDKLVVDELNRFVDEFATLCEQFAFETGREFAIRRITVIADRLVKRFNLAVTMRSGSEVQLEGATVFVPGEGANGFIKHHIHLFTTIDDILKFDITYETSPTLKNLSEANLSSIPHTNVMTSSIFHMKELLFVTEGFRGIFAQANR